VAGGLPQESGIPISTCGGGTSGILVLRSQRRFATNHGFTARNRNAFYVGRWQNPPIPVAFTALRAGLRRQQLHTVQDEHRSAAQAVLHWRAVRGTNATRSAHRLNPSF